MPWDYEEFKNAYVDVSETLREAMSRNRFMRVFVANGYYDLATPHFATEHTLAHLGLDAKLAGNIEMAYYEGGHMMYVHLGELSAMAEDIRRFVSETLKAPGVRQAVTATGEPDAPLTGSGRGDRPSPSSPGPGHRCRCWPPCC